MYKKSVKLTAIGLGLVSFALVSCKSKTNDNKNNESAKPNAASENKQQPRPINNLKVVFNGKIPLGGCTSYAITSVDDKGNVTDITNHAQHSSSNVSIALDKESQNKFTLNEHLNQICAVKENEDNNLLAIASYNPTRKIAAKAGDKAVVSVLNHSYSQQASVEVDQKAEIIAFNVTKYDSSKVADSKYPGVLVSELNEMNKLSDPNNPTQKLKQEISFAASKGEFSDEFVIAFANSNQLKSEKAEYLSDVKIIKAFIDNKEVKIESRIDDKAKVTVFKVAIPAKLSENVKLKLVLNEKLNKTIELTQKRKVKAVSLLDGKINGNVLYSSDKLDVLPANLFTASTNVQFEFFDGEKINVTANYDKNRKLNLGSILNTEFTSSQSSINGFSLSDNTEGALAFNNLLQINLTGITTEFEPKKVALELSESSNNNNPIGELKFYVGNKPTVEIESPDFRYNKTGPKLVSGQQVLPIDGNTNCAYLMSFNFKLADISKPLNNFKDALEIVSVDNSLDVKSDNNEYKVCASKEATPRKASGQENVHFVTIRSKFDPSIQSKFGFKIGELKTIDKAALVDNNSNIVEEIRLKASDKASSNSYRFAIYDAKYQLTSESITDSEVQTALSQGLSKNLENKVLVTVNNGKIQFTVAENAFGSSYKGDSIIGHITLPEKIANKDIVVSSKDESKDKDIRTKISFIISK
ncbi:hypothetical protein [Pigmentibacter ruber]|uniref:hypothetical protein n=1 Tax=Pigmentibacter ruber TaxID=2683196 RepID=UPI00131CFB49|nr:hypothetical protein [Pigmentibacter ruber]